MSITVNHITKSYGHQKVLKEVSFTLEKGEICGFLGPNGAGKSTMMKIITGYIQEYEGEVFVEGINIRKEPLKAKAMIGYLPEHNPLYTEMYIPEYLSYVAGLYYVKNRQLRVKEMMDITGLLPESGKKISQLSKGYRQRVGLAQALIHDPQVLILDEPMTGLDPNQLEEIRNLITVIARDKTVMLSTHIMQEVEAICNRVIIINQGEIAADNLKEEILNKDTVAKVIKVRFAGNDPKRWLYQLPDIANISRHEDGIYYIQPTGGKDPRVVLFHTAAANNSPIIELGYENKNLEEIFREYTKDL